MARGTIVPWIKDLWSACLMNVELRPAGHLSFDISTNISFSWGAENSADSLTSAGLAVRESQCRHIALSKPTQVQWWWGGRQDTWHIRNTQFPLFWLFKSWFCAMSLYLEDRQCRNELCKDTCQERCFIKCASDSYHPVMSPNQFNMVKMKTILGLCWDEQLWPLIILPQL